MHLIRAVDLRVVVEVSQGLQSMLVVLELHKAVTERAAGDLTPLWLLVVHHPALQIHGTHTHTHTRRAPPP